MEMYYFAYGSNMDETQMVHRCPDSTKRCKGYLSNHTSFFSHTSKKWNGGVLSVKPADNSKVWGVVYEISSEDLSNLDYFEGYPNVYDRKKVTIEVPNERTGVISQKECWVYFSKKIEENVEPSEDYLDLVREAHESNNLPFNL